MTGFIAPAPVPTTAGWSFAGYKDPSPVLVSAPAGADGVAVAMGDQIPPGEQWIVDRIVASSTSSTSTELRLYDSQQSPVCLLDGTNTGNMDVTEYPAGLLLGQSGQLVAAWAGASQGAVGTLRLQVRVLRYAAGG